MGSYVDCYYKVIYKWGHMLSTTIKDPAPIAFAIAIIVRPEKFQFLEKRQNHNFDYKIVNFD